jgi:hypothetical protein
LSKRPIALLAALVAIALIAAGCGSSDDESLSKAEYIKQGDALCDKGGAQIQKDVEAYAKENDISLKAEPSEEELTEISENVVIPGVRDQLDGLRGLGTPAEDEELANEVLDELEAGIEAGEEDPNAFVTEGNSLAKANELAGEFGFEECGNE